MTQQTSKWYPGSSRSRILTCFGTLAGLTLSLAGCADVSVNKIPTPTQYVVWTDEMQREADSMEGFRYYLPRPFLNVFESFPVRADIYIADGIVSPDGKYVIIKSVRANSGLVPYMAGAVNAQVPNRIIGMPDDALVSDAIDAQSGTAESALDAAAETARTTVPTGVAPGVTPSAPAATPAAPPPTGISRRGVTNDNGAVAYQPMRGNFDIAYLPDFEEQYVVSSSAGLGNADFELNLGQGWSLQGFNSLTDNSALNQRIFDFLDTASQLAQTAGAAAFGVPPVGALAPGVTDLIEPQSGQAVSDDDARGTPGDDVSLKIVVVHYAAKGLYPIVKPRELQERIKTQGSYHLFFDIFNLIDLSTPATEFDPTAIERSQRDVPKETGKFTVPRYPYQYISFNTFRYMAIEVLTPDGLPFGTLYDKTGTQGDAGDRQAIDLGEVIARYGARDTGSAAPQSGSLQQLARSLPGARFDLGGIEFTFAAANVDDSGENLVVDLDIGDKRPTSTISLDDVKEKIVEEYREFGDTTYDISTDNIEFRNQTDLERLLNVGDGNEDDVDAESGTARDPIAARLRGSEIVGIQQALCMGDEGQEVDGEWGPITSGRLLAYQEEMGLFGTGILTGFQRDKLLGFSDEEVQARCAPNQIDEPEDEEDISADDLEPPSDEESQEPEN